MRGPGVRDLALPLPPRPMPAWRAGRPLKRWRYVGVFGPEVMLCAAEVRVGPAAQRFWALAQPDGRLVGRTALLGRGGVRMEGSRVTMRGERVAFELEVDAAGGPVAVESVSPNGAAGYVWTRKRAGAAVRGTVRVDGDWRPVRAEAVIDETAGYHQRHTTWCWCAGVGRTTDGVTVAWNLVTGVNDDPRASERTVWIDGRPAEVGPVSFAAGLSAVRFAEGGALRLAPWSERIHDARLGPLRSRYRAPFGTFTGALPGAGRLAEGYGVMEEHEAWW